MSPENGWNEGAAAEHGGQVPITDILYREVILDHYREPRGRCEVSPADAMAAGRNPLCGDEISVTLKNGERGLARVCHKGHGCAISVASASMMAELVEGTSVERARELAGAFKAMLLEGGEVTDEMGDLEVLEGVKSYPVRIKCALLPWNALLDALDVLSGGSDE